jgi:hypothetical protein
MFLRKSRVIPSVCILPLFAVAVFSSSCGLVAPADTSSEEKKDDENNEKKGNAELLLTFGDASGLEGAEQGLKQAASLPTGTEPVEVANAQGSGSADAVPDMGDTPPPPAPTPDVAASEVLQEAGSQPPLSEEELKKLQAEQSQGAQEAQAQVIEVDLLLNSEKVASAKLDLSKAPSASLSQLPEGQFDLAIRLVDASGKSVLEGKGKVDVKEGEKNIARLRMRPDEKTGALILVVDGEEKKKPPLPPKEKDRFLNVFSPHLFMEVRKAQALPTCGETKLRLQWVPGNADIEFMGCLSGKPVVESYVISKPEGIAVLRDFLDGVRNDVKALDGQAPAPGQCAPGRASYTLQAKFESADRKGMSKFFVADPACSGIEKGSALHGIIPPEIMEKIISEVRKISGLVGKKVYSRTPEPSPDIQLPDGPGTGGGGTPPPNLEQLVLDQTAVRNQLKDLVRLDCRVAFDCQPIALGAAPCGGPSDFLVISRIASPMQKVMALADMDRRISETINRESNTLGACVLKVPPKSACLQNKCVAK